MQAGGWSAKESPRLIGNLKTVVNAVQARKRRAFGPRPERGVGVHAVVALLDEEHREKVMRLWEKVEVEFGVQPVSWPVPHFSLHVACDYRFMELQDLIERFARATARSLCARRAWASSQGKSRSCTLQWSAIWP